MAKIAFQGPEDLRILAAADLQKANVEGFKKTTFARGEATDVEDGVATAIIDDPQLFGSFKVITDETELPEAREPLTEGTVTAKRAKS